MSSVTSRSSSGAKPDNLSPQSIAFWQSVGIYEEALREKANVEELRKDAFNQWGMLGIGNLRFLCEELRVTHDERASAMEIVRNSEAAGARFPLAGGQ